MHLGKNVGLLVFISALTALAEIPVPAQDIRPPETVTTREAEPVVAAPAEARRGPPVVETLEFLNGDKLRGRLSSIEADGTVQWTHPEARAPIQFSPRNLARISLDPGVGRGRPLNGFVVRLANGNELPGQILTLDQNRLVLNTWYAGTLTIPRKHVRSIRQVRTGNLVYEGPNSMEEWTTGRGGQGRGWAFGEGSLVSTRPGLIGRDMKLPDQARIDFDLSWAGNLGLLISLYVPQIENYSSNCYLLNLNSGFIYLNRSSARGGQNNLGQTQVEELGRRNKARIGIRTSKEQKTFALLVDGNLVKQWRDPGEFAGTGTGLVFYSQGHGSLNISRIQISEWDGRLDDAGSLEGAAGNQDTISMVNRDKVSGTIEKIADNQLRLTSDFAPLSIPLERIDRIELAGATSEGIKEDDSMVRIGLPNEGLVLVKLERMNRERAVVSSPVFGKAEFKPEAFRSIEFNLRRERKKSEDAASLPEELVEE